MQKLANNQPFLSILIPTWNRLGSVLIAVESIKPNYEDIEIIVVDNGSEERVFEQLKNGLKNIPGVQLYRNEQNIGMVRNWNKCISHANGEWMGLLCSDDFYVEGAILRAYELMRLTNQPSLILQDPSITDEIERYPCGYSTARGIMLPQASGNFWHKELINKAGCFDERFEYSADVEIWYRMAYHFPVVKIKNPFAYYNRHETNYMWHTWEQKDFLSQMEMLIRTITKYTYGDVSKDQYKIEQEVNDGIWSTILTIITSTFLSKDKQKKNLFRRYLKISCSLAVTFQRKMELIKALLRIYFFMQKQALKEKLHRLPWLYGKILDIKQKLRKPNNVNL